jgi:ArsR family transcriptional regulator
MKVRNYEIFELHAAFCKTLSNPKRLIILTALGEKEMTVGEFSDLLTLPIANVSQHLKVLRDLDIVTTRKDGHKVYYALTDDRLIEACNLIRKIIVDLHKRKGKMMNLTNLLEIN